MGALEGVKEPDIVELMADDGVRFKRRAILLVFVVACILYIITPIIYNAS